MTAGTAIGPGFVPSRSLRWRRPWIAPVPLLLIAYVALHVVIAMFAPAGAGTAALNPLASGIADAMPLLYWALLGSAFAYVLTLTRRSSRVRPAPVAALTVTGYFAVNGIISAVQELPTGAPGRWLLSHLPAPISGGWGEYGLPTRLNGPPAHTVLVSLLVGVGIVVDFGALFFVTWRAARSAERRWVPLSGRGEGVLVAAVAGTGTLFLLWLAASLSVDVTLHVETGQFGWLLALAPYLTICALAAITVHRRGWSHDIGRAGFIAAASSVFVVLFGQLCAYADWGGWLCYELPWFMDNSRVVSVNAGNGTVGPFAAAALTCCTVFAFPLLSRMIHRLREHPRDALIVLVTANLVDAVATAAGLAAATEYEANPVVRAVGLPAKVLVVTAAAVFLYKKRPGLVWLPACALLSVVCWHLAGLVLNS